jgi:hypothetical protein
MRSAVAIVDHRSHPRWAFLRLLCGVLFVLVLVAGCQEHSTNAVGPHAERFFAALAPSARDCVLAAIDMDHLELALESMTKLPRENEDLPHDLYQISTCTGSVQLREGIAHVILASLPEQRPRLMLEQEDTPAEVDEIERRFAAFPPRLAGRNRAQGFERRGPARLSVAYQRGDIAETPQILMVDLLDHPGQHPPGWTAGELVAITALDAHKRLVAAGVYHGIAWARSTEVVDETTMQVVTWGDIDGRLLFRAEGASRDVLAELLRVFRAGALM